MAIDEEIINKIREVTSDIKQPEAVSRRLIAWLEDESKRDLPYADRVEHLMNLRDAVEIGEDEMYGT